jgi:hypothetical protein
VSTRTIITTRLAFNIYSGTIDDDNYLLSVTTSTETSTLPASTDVFTYTTTQTNPPQAFTTTNIYTQLNKSTTTLTYPPLTIYSTTAYTELSTTTVAITYPPQTTFTTNVYTAVVTSTTHVVPSIGIAEAMERTSYVTVIPAQATTTLFSWYAFTSTQATTDVSTAQEITTVYVTPSATSVSLTPSMHSTAGALYTVITETLVLTTTATVSTNCGHPPRPTPFPDLSLHCLSHPELAMSTAVYSLPYRSLCCQFLCRQQVHLHSTQYLTTAVPLDALDTLFLVPTAANVFRSDRALKVNRAGLTHIAEAGHA